MKKIAVILSFVLLITVFASCKKKEVKMGETSTTSAAAASEKNSTEALEKITEAATTKEVKTTVKTTSAATVPAEQTEQTEQTQEQKVITYISENPENSYIVRVSEKYGSDPQNLIAFITKNSSTPGATVLEFSGKRDSSGNLITTAEELRYLYYVYDGGDIKRASSDGQHNDGYNYVAAKAAIMLGEKYYIPSIPEMREQRRYEDYF